MIPIGGDECPICHKPFKGEWGVRTHMSRKHAPKPKKRNSTSLVPVREEADTLVLKQLPLVVVVDPVTGRRGLLEWES